MVLRYGSARDERKTAQADALERAAQVLGRARLPVIGGLLTDIAGAAAGIALAQKLDGVIDHAAGDGLARATQIMHETGGCPASLGEARNRADFIVLVGAAPLKRDPNLLDTLFPKQAGLPRPGHNARELILLGCEAANVPASVPVTKVGSVDLPTLVSMLSAALHEHRTGADGGETEATLTPIAERLRTCAFPVFVIAPTEGLPIHFAHIQFYGYGAEGDRGLSSGAPRIVEAINAHKNVSVDIGQVMFGQTITLSGDILRQFDGRRSANPNKWEIIQDEGNGTGVVPYKYRASSFENAVQWAVGLEIMLLADDLWRVLFSTDHPNGALFVRYPEIIHLLMDSDERERWLEQVPEASRQVYNLPGIARELTLSEIAIITRGAPARIFGLTDRGHLGEGAVGDVAVYSEQKDRTAMFRSADLVFKDGELVFRDGEVVNVTWGRAFQVAPEFDAAIERRLDRFYDRYYGIGPSSFGVPGNIAGRPERLATGPCRICNSKASPSSRPSPRPFPWSARGSSSLRLRSNGR
jgi:hypothetical protein